MGAQGTRPRQTDRLASGDRLKGLRWNGGAPHLARGAPQETFPERDRPQQDVSLPHQWDRITDVTDPTCAPLDELGGDATEVAPSLGMNAWKK